jgi:hypothetical protein
MLTKIAVAISVLCLVLPSAGFAQGFVQGDKELLLNGAGTSDRDFDSTMFSVQGSFGYFFTSHIEGSIRQSLGFSKVEHEGSSWDATTRGAVDYNFDLGRFWPFVGGSIGYVYGDRITDTWEAGLEGGLKFFVNNTTFLIGMLEYQWFLHSGDTGSESDTGQFVYVVGIGFKW